MKSEYQLKEVLEVLALQRERLNDWILRGYVKGSVETKQGGRVVRSYTPADVQKIEFFRTLIDQGYSREYAGQILKSAADGWEHFSLFLVLHTNEGLNAYVFKKEEIFNKDLELQHVKIENVITRRFDRSMLEKDFLHLDLDKGRMVGFSFFNELIIDFGKAADSWDKMSVFRLKALKGKVNRALEALG